LAVFCQPVAVGDADWMRWAVKLIGSRLEVIESADPSAAFPRADCIPCIQGTAQDLREVKPGVLCSAAGQAAYDFLCTAIDWTKNGAASGIVTLPLHKEGLH